MSAPTVVLVPGLRGHVEDHWQTRLAAALPTARTVPPLGNPVRVAALARAWGSRWHPLGPVGHLNPASGFGDWPGAGQLIAELSGGSVQPQADDAPLHRPQLATS